MLDVVFPFTESKYHYYGYFVDSKLVSAHVMHPSSLCVSIAVVWAVVIFLLCMGILKVPHHWCAWVFWKYPTTMSIVEMFCPHLCCLIYYTSICHLFKKIIIIRMFCVWCDSFPSTSSNSCFHRYDQYKWYNSVAVT